MIVLRTTMAACLVALLVLSAGSVTASEELTRAKDLYRSAAYDDALMALSGISTQSDEAIEVQQYRVLCLIALDRREDARGAMAALVSASPFYRLPEEETAPRVRAMFAEVRTSVLPGIVQRTYADAKAAFDRKDPDAAARFDRVLTLLKDPDVASDASLADLATVATGFRALSKATVIAAAPAPAPGPTTARRTTAGPTSAPGLIVAPVAVSQPFPSPQMREAREWDGEVQLVIDTAGKVLSAQMTKPIHPSYDAQLLRVAKSWTYRPGTKDGIPTQMMKQVAVHLDSRPECSVRIRVGCRQAAP
jgi:hypothetical protein